MNANQLRKKFLNFFQERNHKIVSSASLLPSDPSVLFTTAGMQQFKPYFLGEISPYGKNVVSFQKCFRTSDINEVGDDTHLTFLEMLGNFSFNGYFKETAIELAYQFLFKELKLNPDDFLFTVFKEDSSTDSGRQVLPEDKESAVIWQKLGIPENRIKKYGREDNFWGPTGKEGPCGPCTEIFYKNIEIWNLVFNEYYQDESGKLTPLSQKGVDTGMGLERLTAVMENKNSVFETELFLPLINHLKLIMGVNNKTISKEERIICDHIKGVVFLIAEDILPSNVERGYVLRRIIRRAIRYGKVLNLPNNFLIPLAQKTIEMYRDAYPELGPKESDILTVVQKEEERFEKTLEKGLRVFEKILSMPQTLEEKSISGIDAFHLYDTYGFPLELTIELAGERNFSVDKKGFADAFEKHQKISRAGAEKKFGGVGKDADYQSARLHTATHLLHSALRRVLGENVKQMGSDITPQRLRFDFSHFHKMTEEEIKKVEELVNQKIKENLTIKKEEKNYQEALKAGALAFFKEKYPERVNVYTIFNPKNNEVFSKEICAGPHIEKTSELGYFKIIKEESAGAGIRRIRATLK